MNTNDLMIHVERIVRPVRADGSKLRMRRELLAHLQMAFKEERERGLSESAALAEAQRRLGDPAELTRRLQASVSRFERLSVTPFPRWAARIPMIAAILLPLIIALTPAPAWLTVFRAERTSAGVSEDVARRARFALAGGVAAMELYVLLSYACIVKGIAIASGMSRRTWSMITIYGAMVLVSQLAWLVLICIAGILIFLFFTAVSHIVLGRWHDSARKREG